MACGAGEQARIAVSSRVARRMKEPDREQIERALTTIATLHPQADVVTMGVAEAYVVAQPGEEQLYLAAQRRDALVEGDDYVTWVVTFREGEVVAASSFSSRACSTGRDAGKGSSVG